jgi:hypothetical protein
MSSVFDLKKYEDGKTNILEEAKIKESDFTEQEYYSAILPGEISPQDKELSKSLNELKSFKMKDVLPFSKTKTANDSMRFEVGEGLKKDIAVKPGPRISTLEAIERGEKPTQVVTDKGVIDIKTGKNVKEAEVLPFVSETGKAHKALKVQIEKQREIEDNTINAFEQFISDVKNLKQVPFAGSAKETIDFARIGLAANRYLSNKYDLSTEEGKKKQQEDVIFLNKYIDESSKEKTFGAKVVSVIDLIPSFAGELYLTGGTYTVGKKATEKVISKTTKELLEKVLGKKVKNEIKEKIASYATRGMGSLVGATLQTPIAGLTRITSSAAQKMAPELTIDNSGEITATKEGQSAFNAFAKAVGETWVETVSERTGKLLEFIPKGSAKLLEKIPTGQKDNIIKKSLSRVISALNPKIEEGALNKVLNTVGWNGIIGEIGEERIGDAMHGVLNKLGLSDQEFEMPTKEQWLVEAVSFALPGVGVMAYNSLSAKEKEKVDKQVSDKIKEWGKIPAGLSIEDVSGEEATKNARENIEKADKDYKDWLNKNPEAIKEVEEVADYAKNIPNKANRKKFLETAKEEFDRKYKNAYSAEKYETSKMTTDQLVQDEAVKTQGEIAGRVSEETRGKLVGEGEYALVNGTNERPYFEKQMRKAGMTEEQIASVLDNTQTNKIGKYNAEDVLYGITEYNLKIKEKVKQETKKTSDNDKLVKKVEEAITKQPKITPSKIDRTINPPSTKRTITATEKTLIKKRIAEQKKGARAGFVERGKIEAGEKKNIIARERRIATEKVVDIRRDSMLQRLKQRILDRQKLTKQERKTESLKDTIKWTKTLRNGIITYAKRYLPTDIRGKVLTKSFMNAKDIGSMDRAMRKIDEWAKENKKKSLINDIKNSLKSTKTKKQFGKPVGKYTPQVQEALDAYRIAVEFSKVEAQDQIIENLGKRIEDSPYRNLAIVNNIIERASDLKNKNEIELAEILTEINNLKEKGSLARDLEKFNRQADVEREVEESVKTITGGKGIDEKTKSLGVQQSDKFLDKVRRTIFTAGVSQMGMQDIADILSSKDRTVKSGESVLNKILYTLPEYNKYNTDVKKKANKIRSDIKEVYNIEKERDVDNKIIENSEKVFLGVFENKKGINLNIEFSKDQAMKVYAILKNKDLKEAMMHEDGMAFTEEIVDAVEGFLTEEDKKFVEKTFEFNREFYKEINKVYRNFAGVDLPYDHNYVHIRREGVEKEVDGLPLENHTKDVYSVSKGSLKSRVQNLNTIRIDGLLQSQLAHISEMEHYIAYAEKVRQLNSIFENNDVKNAIKQEYGTKPLVAINDFRKDLARGGIEASKKLKWMDKFLSNFTFAQLAIKPKQIATQLTSLFTYADRIPTGEWIKGFAKFLTNPVKYGKELYSNSEYLQARGMNIDKDMQNIVRGNAYKLAKKKSSIKNILMLNVQAGDQGAIIIGGYPVYNYYRQKALKEGKSESEAKKYAIDKFEKETDLTQQSSQIATLSQTQRSGSLGRLLTAFKSSPNLYIRKEVGVLRDLISGKASLPQVAKTIAIYHFLMPMLYQIVSDGFRWDPDEQKRAVLVGSLNGIFIIGDGLEYIVKSALNQRAWDLDNPITGEFKRVGDAVRKIVSDWDFDIDDVLLASKQLFDTGGKVVGIPTDAALKQFGSISEIKEGEYVKALMMLSGWSKYQADKKAEALKDKKKKKASKVFEGINLDEINFNDIDLEGIDLEGIDLTGIDLGDSNLDFDKINFEDIDLEGIDLSSLGL